MRAPGGGPSLPAVSAGTVVVVGLGPAGADLVSPAAAAALAAVAPEARFLRTARHPAAAVAEGAVSFDDIYEREPDFDAVYRAIVDRLEEEAARRGRIVYAVPGSPRVGEASVELLVGRGGPAVDVVPAMSFLDLVWDRLGIDPLRASPRVIDASEFAVAAAGDRGPLVVAQCWSAALLSDIKLAAGDSAPATAVVLHHLGLPDEAVLEVAWEDLDRSLAPDHLTTVWVPRLAAPVAAELVRLEELVRTLRQRCPWDRAQTHSSLTRHLLEESYEVIEAIENLEEAGDTESADAYAHLEEELGDLLFQVYFHSVLGAEEGQFDLATVARGIHDKLVGRHPHVFGDVTVDSAEAVVTNWERIKAAEKGRQSLMDGIPAHLPALHHAAKIQRKAASVGFDWDSAAGPLAKVEEELGEVRQEASTAPAGPVAPAALTHEVGDLLFAVVNAARHLGVDPEAALRASSAEFRRRFVAMERLAAEAGTPLEGLDLAALDALWERAKAGA